jgi:phenylacetic acid degradation operon negative regulatory protein
MPFAPQDLKRAHKSRPLGVIFFALGLLSRVEDSGVDSALLLRVTSELGLPEAACRAAILRMRREGMLLSERDGRRARYSIALPVAAMQQRWNDYFRAGPPAWNGVFAGLLHDFSEADRPRRDALRRAAKLAGYGLLRPGLLISPDDRWSQLSERFAVDEHAGRILRIGLTLAIKDARKLAGELWQLDMLAGRYRQIAADTRTRLADALDTARAPGSAALRQLHALSGPIYDAVTQDPALPKPLLPDEWPAEELGAALVAVNQQLGPAAVEYVRNLAHNRTL